MHELGYLLSLGRKRVTLVLQTGQVPWAILRPFSVSLTSPLATCLFSRHLTQYPSNSMRVPPFLVWAGTDALCIHYDFRASSG